MLEGNFRSVKEITAAKWEVQGNTLMPIFFTSEACITGDKFKRHCTLFWREQLNGEEMKRDCLCYSPSLLTTADLHQLVTAPRDLARHESCENHLRCPHISLEEQKESDRKYWSNILTRVLSVIKFLSSRGFGLARKKRVDWFSAWSYQQNTILFQPSIYKSE